ncbi:hypothetical protein BN1221_00243 [Brenneria goodwinii]|uniref:Uncharacterized protein n=1 Tax=Brenneria goodwinii TaxID=1109412 RepID=A0A0G4JPI2_9GAMM|nr:hypothetical protein BN1221_00243 [Brenneria goodwinii]
MAISDLNIYRRCSLFFKIIAHGVRPYIGLRTIERRIGACRKNRQIDDD